MRNVAAVAVVQTSAAKAAYPIPAFIRGKTEWQMITQFRVTPMHERFAQIVAEASDGQMLIRLRSREGNPPSKVIDDLNSGKVEMAWGTILMMNSPTEDENAPRIRKVPAADFMIMPFGLTPEEFNAWIEHCGGHELVDRIFEQIGCKYLPAGNTGIQMGGWYAKEINTIDDLKGMKIRISLFGAEVLKAVGAEPYDVAPWSEDAKQALKDGWLDAFERGGPAGDFAAGLHKLDKYRYYYYPDWHEPSVPKALFINQARWNTLPSYLQTIISSAATWLNHSMLVDRMALNSNSLASLVQDHGVQLRQFPEPVLSELAEVTDRILQERASQDKLSQEVFDSIMQFKQKVTPWSMVSHQPFLSARGNSLLNFKS
jgi:TRAP-type mannitol/chloroaromatic compound transport system substrate-binding protein